MTFIELIGFIITMIALMMLSYKQSKEARKKQKEEPDEYSPDQLKRDPAVQQLLKTLNIEVPASRFQHRREEYEEEEEAPPSAPVQPPPPQIIADYSFKPGKIQKAYRHQKHTSLVQGNLLKKVSLKEAMILHVIFGPPKG